MPVRFPRALDESRLAFPVAMIRTLETKLLDRQRYERLLDAANPDEVYRVLSETEYGEAVSASQSVYQYESMLSAELERVYKYVAKYVGEPAITGSLLIRHDFHNIKVFLKETLLEEPDGSDGLFGFGVVGLAELRKGVNEVLSGSTTSLPKPYADAVSSAASVYKATRDPAEIDIVIDSHTFALGTVLAKQSQSEMLQELWMAWADLSNFKSFARAALRGREPAFLSKVLLDYGKVGRSALEKAYTPSPEALSNLAEVVKSTTYAAVVAAGFRDFGATGSFTAYEKAADNYIQGILAVAKRVALGLEPIVAYLLTKENEIRNLRIILTGKINRLPTDAIRGRLRDAHV